MRKSARTNKERAEWIMNDEGLYRWWKSYHSTITTFIRTNCIEIDKIIDQLLEIKHEQRN